jgi:hypothetical protein
MCRCLHKPPRAISLLDVYKEHVLIGTVSLVSVGRRNGEEMDEAD